MVNKDVEFFKQSVLAQALYELDEELREKYGKLDPEQRNALDNLLRLQAMRIVDIVYDAVTNLDVDIDTIRFEHIGTRLVRLYAKNPQYVVTDDGDEPNGPEEMYIGECEHWFEHENSEDGSENISKVVIRTTSFRPMAKQKEEIRYYTL